MSYRYRQYESAVKLMPAISNQSHPTRDDANAFAGQLIHASVLFADIRDATAHLSAAATPAALEELSIFYTLMQQAVLEQGGMVSHCGNKAFVGLFGPTRPIIAHAQQAAGVAMRMLTRLASINQRRISRGEEPLRVGLGVNSGEMIVSSVQSEQWRHESVQGHTVETAVALSHVNKRAPIHTVFVGSETAAALRLQRNWYLANLGAVSNNGSGPLDVHALVLLKN